MRASDWRIRKLWLKALTCVAELKTLGREFVWDDVFHNPLWGKPLDNFHYDVVLVVI